MTMTQVAIYAAIANRTRHQLYNRLEAANPFYPTLCTIVNSTQESEDYDWLGDLPGMREWLGDRIFKELSSYGFSIKNRTWESSLLMHKEKIDDGNTNYYDNVLNALAEEAAYHPDELLIELMNAAEAIRCFDGQYFFDTDHAMGDSGTQSNLKTRTVVSSTAPTAAEMRQVVYDSITDFYGFKRDNGKPMFRPTVEPISDLLLAVPVAWYQTAVKAFGAQLVVEGGAAVDNFIISRPKIIALQGLTSAIDVYRTGQAIKPFAFQSRKKVGFSVKGNDDREFKHFKVMGDGRYSVGVLAWWNAIRNKLQNAS